MPHIRIGLTRFEGVEALRSQRWAITGLIVAKTLFWLSLTALLWLGVLKPSLLHVAYRGAAVYLLTEVESSGPVMP
jgi:hypothetical protein